MGRSRFRNPGPAVVAALLAITAAPLHAQTASDSWTAPGWVGDAAFVSLNALSGGLTAGLFQKLRGESFADGFTRGALGGTVYYAGLRVTAQRFDGAGLLGGQIAAAGTSMVRNAADGRPLLERMFVPLGPLHLYVDLADGVAVRPKINVVGLTTLVSAVAESELEWDAGATLSAGAPVFHARGRRLVSDGRILNGYMRGGSIFISDIPDTALDRVLAHERVHVSQGHWLFLAWSDPAEAWLIDRIPLGSTLYRYFDIDLVASELRGALYEIFNVSRTNRLHEIEAGFLDDR